jgi:hypothetical protein
MACRRPCSFCLSALIMLVGAAAAFCSGAVVGAKARRLTGGWSPLNRAAALGRSDTGNAKRPLSSPNKSPAAGVGRGGGGAMAGMEWVRTGTWVTMGGPEKAVIGGPERRAAGGPENTVIGGPVRVAIGGPDLFVATGGPEVGGAIAARALTGGPALTTMTGGPRAAVLAPRSGPVGAATGIVSLVRTGRQACC